MLIDFINWWFYKGLSKFVGRLKKNLEKINDFFSIDLLVVTLFQPFRLIDTDSQYGRDLGSQMRAKFDYLLACLIGFVIRFIFLIIGITVIFTTLIINLIQIIAWVVLPFSPIIGAILFVIEGKI